MQLLKSMLKGKNGRTADTPQKNGKADALNGQADDKIISAERQRTVHE